MSASNYKIPKYSNLASFNPSPVRRLQPYYSRITYHSFVGKEIKYSEDTVKALNAFKIVPEKINELKKGEEILDHAQASKKEVFDMVNDYYHHQIRSIMTLTHRLAFNAGVEIENLGKQLKQQQDKIKSLEEDILEREQKARAIILNKRYKKKLKSARRRLNYQRKQNQVLDCSESVMEINSSPSLREEEAN